MFYTDLFSSAIGSGTAAETEAIRRRTREQIHDIKERNRRRLFTTLSQILDIGGKLYKSYSENQELIDYAEGRGYEVTTSSFENIFGSPRFMSREENLTGFRGLQTKEFDATQMRQMMLYDKFKEMIPMGTE